MTRQDDELVRRYQEASAQDDARPGAHVRDAVRAHAQMLAAASAATAASPVAGAPSRAAANQSRWKISALATVALVGLTGLLMLQFERGTPEERDIAFGQRMAPTPAPSAEPAPPLPVVPEVPEAPGVPQVQEAVPDTTRDLASPQPNANAQKPTPAAPAAPAKPSAKTTPPFATAPPQAAAPATPAARSAPAPAESETLMHPGAAATTSGFPASPPPTLRPPDRPSPPLAPSPAQAPHAETHERSAMQEKSVSRAMTAPRPAPLQQDPPAVARGLPGGDTESSDTAAAAPQIQTALDPSLPRGLRDAARVGNAPEVENLVRQGVPVDARDTAGRTALMIAALNGHTAAVQKLLALGAQTTLVDGDGLTAAQHARRWGYAALADLIDAAR